MKMALVTRREVRRVMEAMADWLEVLAMVFSLQRSLLQRQSF